MDVGQVLRRRREDLGYSLEEAQAATKIRLRYLQAIEAGRYGDLPGPVYTRGFIRSYAAFLGLDGRALAAAWPPAEEAPGPAAAPDAGSEHAPGAPGSAGGSPAGGGGPGGPPATDAAVPLRPRPAPHLGLAARRPVVLALLAIALVAVVAAALTWRAGQGSRGPAAPAAATPTAAAKATTSATAAPASPPATPTATAPAAPTLAVRRGTDAAGNPVATYTVSGARSVTVSVRATARCWLDVSVDGTAADPNLTLEPGQTRTWQAQRQVTMRIGYPPGLLVTVDGLALPAFPDQNPINVAFVLGGATP
jgi:cytoskeleton protein RodZ